MSDKSTFIEIKCPFCGKKFDKTLHRYKDAIKNNYNLYCSKKCRVSARTTSKNLNCCNCGNDILITKSVYNGSNNKRFFCSSSCSAIFNNKQRGERTFSEKEHIRKGLLDYHERMGMYKDGKKAIKQKSSCVICSKEFKPSNASQYCCSRICGYIYQFGSLPYTKDDVINNILEKHKELSRTPQKRDCKRRLSSAAKRLFGSWNKAIKECGLKPNPSKYQKVRLKCKDGHIADSISEMIVDDWFFSRQLKHNRNKKYFGSNMDCDFYFPDYDLWVEYFGLIGQSKEYDITVKAKRKLIKKLKLNFVELVPDDLYPSRKFESVFGHIF